MNSLQSRNLILRLHWLQYGNKFLCLHWLQYSHNILRLHWLQYRRRIAHLHWLQCRNHRYLITDLETIRCGLLSWNFWENLDPLIYEEAENGDFDINPSVLSLFNAIFHSLLSLNDYWLSSDLAILTQLGLHKLKFDFVIFRYIENWLAWEILTFLNNHLWHPIYPFSQNAWSSQTDSKPAQTYNNWSGIECKISAVFAN